MLTDPFYGNHIHQFLALFLEGNTIKSLNWRSMEAAWTRKGSFRRSLEVYKIYVIFIAS